MKHPRIIEHKQSSDKKEITLKLYIPKEIVYFEGHFKDAPILSGVVQVDWAICFAHQYFDIPKEKFLNMEHLKFTHIIPPEQSLSLSLKIENDRLIFKYFDKDIIFSGGKIKVSP